MKKNDTVEKTALLSATMRKCFCRRRAGKGVLALLFALSGVSDVSAQDAPDDTLSSDYTSEDYIKAAKENIHIGVNPFNGESLHLYELRRKLERRQLEAQLHAPSTEEVYQKTEEIVSQMLQGARGEAQQQRDSFAAVIEDLNNRINALESSLSDLKTAPAVQAAVEPVTDLGDIPSLEKPLPVQEADLPATYLGYLDFGTGPRLLYRDTEQQLQSFAVDEYAPLAGDDTEEAKITAINKNGATLDNGGKIIIPSVRSVLSPSPLPAVSSP